MKELLKITHMNDDICEIAANIDNEEDWGHLASALLGILINGENEAKDAIMAAVTAFVEHEDELKKVAKRAVVEFAPSRHAS